jgi:hypothetical protein
MFFITDSLPDVVSNTINLEKISSNVSAKDSMAKNGRSLYHSGNYYG